ncbi:PIN domain-containing protein [Candidatus Woesearchaeota archaeon]|nr:PIN domain-containing protein [Candidatus Woesearchaeota archaeon]
MIFDTSAWVEIFEGTEKSRYAADVLRKNDCFTSIVTVAETAEWCAKKGLRHKTSEYIELIKTGSRLLGLDESISRMAGELNRERKKAGIKWGMIDSIIVATAQVYGLKVLTKDNAFRDLQDAEVL